METTASFEARSAPSLYPTEGPNSQVRPSGAKTRERGSGNFFSAQAQQRTAVEDFAVGFERHSVLKSPLVKQRGIVREVQESGGNFLDFGHAVVNQVKASFFVGGFGVIRILQPADEPIAHLKLDRKSTRLNSSHQIISYAVFCLK